MTSRCPWLSALVAVLLVVFGGCGGGGETSVATSPAVTPAPTRTARPTTRPAPPVTASPSPLSSSPTPALTPPTTGGPAQAIRKGNASLNVVAFSFDAGSDAGYTALILDTLAANGIRASFGITGRWAERNPDLLRRIVNEGHGLINHTYDHASMTGLSTGLPAQTREERWNELDRTEAIVADLTGATTKPHFRPPYGDADASVNEDAGARGYAYNIMWTVDSGGWRGLPSSEIRQRCLELAEPGAIYVFHVGSASQDGPALRGIIDGLRAAGYSIGSVPDVLKR